MKNYVRVIIIMCIAFVVGIIGFSIATGAPLDDYSERNVDILQLNDIRETVKKNWDNLLILNEQDFGAEFVVLDNENNILYSSTSATEDTVLTVEEAVKRRYPYSYVVKDDRVAGCVIMLDSGEDTYEGMKNRMLLGFGICTLSKL